MPQKYYQQTRNKFPRFYSSQSLRLKLALIRQKLEYKVFYTGKHFLNNFEAANEIGIELPRPWSRIFFPYWFSFWSTFIILLSIIPFIIPRHREMKILFNTMCAYTTHVPLQCHFTWSTLFLHHILLQFLSIFSSLFLSFGR